MNNYRELDYKKLYYDLLQKNNKDSNGRLQKFLERRNKILKEQRLEQNRKNKERWNNQIKPFLIGVGVNLIITYSVVVGFFIGNVK